jgi:ABC-type xylose transport system permease subunit
VIVVCHVVYFVFWSLCRLSFCDRCLSCCSFFFFGHCVGCPSVVVVCRVVYFVFLVINNMTNNDHRRTDYTMTKKQNKQHDKQRPQKDSLHNDQKNKINNMTNNDHRRTAYTMTKKTKCLSCCLFCVFGHCVGCPSVIVVCHVVYFVFLVIAKNTK